MSKFQDLPSEIQHVIFKYVGRRHLLQCLLTCQAWRNSSGQALYSTILLDKFSMRGSDVTISLDDHSHVGMALLIRIMETCFELAEKFTVLLVRDPSNKTKEQLLFLDKIITLCPNITRFSSKRNIPREFWKRLAVENDNDEWPNIQILPSIQDYNSLTFELYSAIIKKFRRSLSKFELIDDLMIDRTNSTPKEQQRLELFNSFAENLKECADLQDLIIVRHTTNGFLNLDQAIDHCGPSLQSLEITLKDSSPKKEKQYQLPFYLIDNKQDYYALSMIRRRTEVKRLICSQAISPAVDRELSLYYLIYKFPCLNHLEFVDYCEKSPLSTRVMIEFFKYVVRIPMYIVKMKFRQDIIADRQWVDLMRDNKVPISAMDISCTYKDDGDGVPEKDDDGGIYDLSIMSKRSTGALNKLKVSFRSTHCSSTMPFVNCINIMGCLLQNELKLSGIGQLQDRSYKQGGSQIPCNILYGEWFFRVSETCPAIKRLVVEDIGYFVLEEIHDKIKIPMGQHAHLTSIKFTSMRTPYLNDPFWLELSTHVPLLEHLSIDFAAPEKLESTTRIHMPHTSFITFDLKNTSSPSPSGQDSSDYGIKLEDRLWNLYLKINIVVNNYRSPKEYYFKGRESTLQPCTAKVYREMAQDPHQFALEICCRKIKWLLIQRDNTSVYQRLKLDDLCHQF